MDHEPAHRLPHSSRLFVAVAIALSSLSSASQRGLNARQYSHSPGTRCCSWWSGSVCRNECVGSCTYLPPTWENFYRFAARLRPRAALFLLFRAPSQLRDENFAAPTGVRFSAATALSAID